MNHWKWLVPLALAVAAVVWTAASSMRLARLGPGQRWAARADQGTNVTTRFHATAVDQDGAPLPGVRVDVLIAGVNEKWATDPAGANARNAFKNITLYSDGAGKFSFEATGTYVKFLSVTMNGYRWLFDKDSRESDR